MAVELVRPYCTLANVQEETRNDDADRDDLFCDCINRASRMVEEHCNADFWQHDHTETPLEVLPEWTAENLLCVPWPIRSLTLVEDVTNDDPVTVDADTYRVLTGYATGAGDTGRVLSRGMVISDSPWPKLDYKVCLRLTGVFGYALAPGEEEGEYLTTAPPTNLPAQVTRAATIIAATLSAYYHKQWRDAQGQTQEMLVMKIPDEAVALLKRWRHPLA